MVTFSGEYWSTYVWNFENFVYISHAYCLSDAMESIIEETSKKFNLSKIQRLEFGTRLKAKNPIVISKDTTGSLIINKLNNINV